MTVAFFALSALDILDALDLTPSELGQITKWIYSLQASSNEKGSGNFLEVSARFISITKFKLSTTLLQFKSL